MTSPAGTEGLSPSNQPVIDPAVADYLTEGQEAAYSYAHDFYGAEIIITEGQILNALGVSEDQARPVLSGLAKATENLDALERLRLRDNLRITLGLLGETAVRAEGNLSVVTDGQADQPEDIDEREPNPDADQPYGVELGENQLIFLSRIFGPNKEHIFDELLPDQVAKLTSLITGKYIEAASDLVSHEAKARRVEMINEFLLGGKTYHEIADSYGLTYAVVYQDIMVSVTKPFSRMSEAERNELFESALRG